MLLIEQVCEKNNIKSNYVKCPICGGRLCDKPIEEKAKAVSVDTNQLSGTSSRIILKCPKCPNKFFIQFTKE